MMILLLVYIEVVVVCLSGEDTKTDTTAHEEFLKPQNQVGHGCGCGMLTPMHTWVPFVSNIYLLIARININFMVRRKQL
jgi:hypothetical protein